MQWYRNGIDQLRKGIAIVVPGQGFFFIIFSGAFHSSELFQLFTSFVVFAMLKGDRVERSNRLRDKMKKNLLDAEDRLHQLGSMTNIMCFIFS